MFILKKTEVRGEYGHCIGNLEFCRTVLPSAPLCVSFFVKKLDFDNDTDGTTSTDDPAQFESQNTCAILPGDPTLCCYVSRRKT